MNIILNIVHHVTSLDYNSSINVNFRNYSDACIREILDADKNLEIEPGKRSYRIDCNLDQFKIIRFALKKFVVTKFCHINYSKLEISLVDYNEADPLLLFVGFECDFINSPNSGIRQDFMNYTDEFSKKAVLSCQKDLIDAEFGGNAHW